MNDSDLLAAVQESIFESVLSDSFGLVLCDDLERLEDAGVDLVLNSRVFALKVLSDDDDIDRLLVSDLNVWQLEKMNNFRYCNLPFTYKSSHL